MPMLRPCEAVQACAAGGAKLNKLKTRLRRVIGGVEWQIAGNAALQDIFPRELWQGRAGAHTEAVMARGGMCMPCSSTAPGNACNSCNSSGLMVHVRLNRKATERESLQ